MALAQIRFRRDTTAGWAAANPVLSTGEPGFDTQLKKMKVGDGVTSWSALPWGTIDQATMVQVLAAADAFEQAGEVNDPIVKGLIDDEESETGDALRSTFVSVPAGIADGEVPVWDASTESWIPGTVGVGAGVNILGTLPNQAALPPTGDAGDGYLIGGDLWVWVYTAWSNVGPVRGPKGEPGAQGAPGAPSTVAGPQGVPGARGVQGLPGASSLPTADAVASYLSLPGQVRTADTFADSQRRNRLRVDASIEKANTGMWHLALFGMSIATSIYSIARILGANWEAKYGIFPAMQSAGYTAGGNYAAYRGWDKQPSSGPGYGRAVGTSASTALDFDFYGDTVWIEYDRESDSAPGDIKIDGVTVGQSPDAGGQAFFLRQVFTVPMGHHKITVHGPAGAGKVYFSRVYGFPSTGKGVLISDFTLGGSLLTNMIKAPNPGTGELAPIPTVGDAGIRAHVDHSRFDGIVIMQDVNDTGTGTDFAADFKPTLDQIVSITGVRRTPILLISTMAGNMAVNFGNNAGVLLKHQKYEQIRASYRDAQQEFNHVTHLDWHEATRMDDVFEYAKRYYSPAVVINPTTGVASGDFIHPLAIGHKESRPLISAYTGEPLVTELSSPNVRLGAYRRAASERARTVTTARQAAPSLSWAGSTDLITAPAPHGLIVGDRVWFGTGSGSPFSAQASYWVTEVPSDTTFKVSTSPGGSTFDVTSSGSGAVVLLTETRVRMLGEGSTALILAAPFDQNQLTSLFRGLGALSATASTVPGSIASSGLSDKWGRYISPANSNVSVGMLPVGQVVAYTARFRGSLNFRTSPGNVNFVTPDGAEFIRNYGTSVDTTNVNRDGGDGDPITTTILVKKTVGTGSAYVTISAAQLYELSVTHGPTPILN